MPLDGGLSPKDRSGVFSRALFIASCLHLPPEMFKPITAQAHGRCAVMRAHRSCAIIVREFARITMPTFVAPRDNCCGTARTVSAIVSLPRRAVPLSERRPLPELHPCMRYASAQEVFKVYLSGAAVSNPSQTAKGPGKPEPFAVALIFALANIREASVT